VSVLGRPSRLERLGASVGSLDRPGQPASVATNGFRARSPEIDPVRARSLRLPA
jgi:hypothetical protein